MHKFSTLVCIVVLLTLLSISLCACTPTPKNDVVADSDIATVASTKTPVYYDSDLAPDSYVIDSITIDSSLVLASDSSDADKIRTLMYNAELNEVEALRYSFFKTSYGTTNIGKRSGSLIYQKKYTRDPRNMSSVTMKLPTNYNFSAIEVAVLTNAKIQYIENWDKLYNMSAKPGDIHYNSESDLLEVPDDSWSRKQDSFGSFYHIAWTRKLEETKNISVNWECENIVNADSSSIELLANDNGDEYYHLTFDIDSSVANADKATIDKLEKDNGAQSMSIQYMHFTVDIWKNGLFKEYEISESWRGTYYVYSGSASVNTKVIYSYSERDNDHSYASKIKESLS